MKKLFLISILAVMVNISYADTKTEDMYIEQLEIEEFNKAFQEIINKIKNMNINLKSNISGSPSTGLNIKSN